MEKASSHKLVELLRPSLAVNAFFGAHCDRQSTAP
ncbi:unnamed protein product [Ectocarpus sp. CCAP 1310/34]|nr:unnamed protein product [Ectocarpus sp. CCAP 1310/34]